jgi:ATP-dependent RNA helicase SUPV3L1/SUV3
VSYRDVPSLPEFENIKKLLEVERRTIIKVNGHEETGEDFVRSVEDAQIVLNFLQELQVHLLNFFELYPSLMGLFSNDFLSISEFVQRDYILDICFLDDCLIPEKEMFFFGQDGGLNTNVLDLHLKHFKDWVENKKNFHESTQTFIKEKFDMSVKGNALDCQCVGCLADYRTKLREFVHDSCLEIIEKTYSEISENLKEKEVDEVSGLYFEMQKNIEKFFHKIRYRLKRSTINRLESNIKGKLKELFTYPSDLAKAQEEKLNSVLKGLLYEDDIKEDLLVDADFKKFFASLSTSLWRNERYISREFRKFTKSIMILKRTDISGKILQEYIGEFWVHSQARTIKRRIVYHLGPTNSGKTYHAIERLAQMEKGCYLAPLRLLAAELYDTLNSKGAVTTLLTGEEVIEKENATHYSSTIEMARLAEFFDCCVIDEIQMITDPQRGWAWTRALVNIFAKEVHICGDGSVLELIEQIVGLCGDELEIRNYERMTELNVEKSPIVLGDLQKSDALIVFSRRNALRYKRDLEKAGFKVSIVYGRLSPEVRREQARKFDSQETDIMVSTDAIAMGMNLPIRRIVFSTLSKFFNSQEYEISESEVKQIAGRAGRYQRFPTGYVTCLSRVEEGIERIETCLGMELNQQRKCMVGPDLDIYNQVNGALEEHGLPRLRLSEFLRLFNTMSFQAPFHCVELKEMIELSEMVEDADSESNLSTSENFGFACAPVNLGLVEHVQYYVWILNHFVNAQPILNEGIDSKSSDIDYLETSIKCVELYQWLSRHFNNKHFSFEEEDLLANKSEAVEKLNVLLSDKIVPTCASCGVKMSDTAKFNICEKCFKERRYSNNRGRGGRPGDKKASSSSGGGKDRGKKRRNYSRKRKTTKK